MKTYENPLLGHTRMRALFRALVESRALSQKLPGEPRALFALPQHLEACWVGTAIDLRDDDLALDAHGTAMIEHIRHVGLRTGTGKPRARDLRGTLDSSAQTFPGTPGRAGCCVRQARRWRRGLPGVAAWSSPTSGHKTSAARSGSGSSRLRAKAISLSFWSLSRRSNRRVARST